jgi:hypothetical protein
MSAKQTENRIEKRNMLGRIMNYAIYIRCNANSKDYDKISMQELRMVEKSIIDMRRALASR